MGKNSLHYHGCTNTVHKIFNYVFFVETIVCDLPLSSRKTTPNDTNQAHFDALFSNAVGTKYCCTE